MEKIKTEEKVIAQMEAPVTPETIPVVVPSAKPPFSTGIMIGVAVALLAIIGVAGFYAGKGMGSTGIVPATPTVTPTASLLPTDTLIPSETLTVIPTATASPTVAPTVAIVTKTANIKEWENSFTLKFALDVPSDVTVTEGKVSSWNGIILRKGTKNFMAFNLPYELHEIQGYSAITNVDSTNIADLKRVRSERVFANSGSYSFAVAYVTSGSLASGTDCTAPIAADATTSPCASPALTYSSSAGVGFGAYCSIDPAYIAICDQVMKTIEVVKL